MTRRREAVDMNMFTDIAGVSTIWEVYDYDRHTSDTGYLIRFTAVMATEDKAYSRCQMSVLCACCGIFMNRDSVDQCSRGGGLRWLIKVA